MKLTISQQTFNYAIQSVSKAIPSRQSHPVLANILLKATEDNRLTLTAFDLQLGIQITVNAQVESEGEYTLPAKLSGDVVSRLPNEDITLEVDLETGAVAIKTSSGNYQMQGIAAEEFPELPTIESANAGKLTLESVAIKQALSNVLFSASTEEIKQILCGVNIHLHKDGVLKLATTDGHRLSVSTIKSTQLESDVEITIPAKTLGEVLKTLKVLKINEFDLEFDTTQVRFVLGDVLITSRVLDGQYPMYAKLIPSSFQRTLEVSKLDLLTSLERIAVISDQKNNIVKLEMTPENVSLTVNAQDVGNGHESVACDYDCSSSEEENAFEIGFNIKYLSEALKAFTCENITVSMNTALSPSILQGENDDFVHLIMPVQIRK